MSESGRRGLRYVTPIGPEVDFQPGSRGRVMRNYLQNYEPLTAFFAEALVKALEARA